MTKLYTLIASGLLLLAACKSASKAYDHGNYTEAVEIAVKKLQKDPLGWRTESSGQKCVSICRTPARRRDPQPVQQHQPNRWEQIYRQYIMLQNLYENIQRSPAAMQAVKPVSYADYVATYKSKTGDAYYEDGLQLLDKANGDREGYKQAYYAFRNALNFKPADRAIIEKLEEAKMPPPFM